MTSTSVQSRRRQRRELHDKFGIALKNHPDAIDRMKIIYSNFDFDNKSLEENIKSFAEELGMNYDYMAKYINRKIDQEIRRRLKAKNMEARDLYGKFVRNGKSLEESVSLLSKEVNVPYELLIAYIRPRIAEVSMVAVRLYALDEREIRLSLFEDQSEEEIKRVSEAIHMSPKSIKNYIRVLNKVIRRPDLSKDAVKK
ncbi:MAG: hypothetical protein WC520_02855 [Candidatus Paceibacterota bacterium]